MRIMPTRLLFSIVKWMFYSYDALNVSSEDELNIKREDNIMFTNEWVKCNWNMKRLIAHLFLHDMPILIDVVKW